MGRELQPKCKQCRRVRQKLFLRGERCFSSKCAMVKRNFPPGLHGPKQAQGERLSGYGKQLREKQKCKKTYGILERQLHLYYEKALASKKVNNEVALYRLLELRLDNVVYRAGFAKSRNSARQLVNHGHFCVNSKRVDIPSYQVDLKDKISINLNSQKSPAFANLSESLKNKESVYWLLADDKELSIKLTDLPDPFKIVPEFSLKDIIEFYSR
jgi:small subunit ribosomal protein S4